jgi:UDPglucose 6-dehydrogenase
MTKYAANAMLGTKISFINEIANLCELLGGDIDSVRRGICSDSRIGFQFLYPGLGFGGSCFPKDMNALVNLARQVNYPARLLEAVLEVNRYQKGTLQRKIQEFWGSDLNGRTLAIWGLSFKPRTDDIRESPALELIAHLLAGGTKVRVHDPKAMKNTEKVFGNKIEYCNDMYDALVGADGLCVVSEWNEFRTPSFEKMITLMKTPVIFDGRNVYDARRMRKRGFTYFGIGRR